MQIMLCWHSDLINEMSSHNPAVPLWMEDLNHLLECPSIPDFGQILRRQTTLIACPCKKKMNKHLTIIENFNAIFASLNDFIRTNYVDCFSLVPIITNIALNREERADCMWFTTFPFMYLDVDYILNP